MASQQQNEPIAIVGSGCRFPGGASSPSALWDLIEKPHDVAKCLMERYGLEPLYDAEGTHTDTSKAQYAYLLEEDHCEFDASFLGLSSAFVAEGDGMDLQQRLLLETVYEALESGGHTVEGLRGSNTAVFVGATGVGSSDTLLRDPKTTLTSPAIGADGAIISTRVSHFFDWRGPSMTIDTACFSGLVAVHRGVQALRSGESRVAVGCGTQLILEPDSFINEAKIKMRSAHGRSKMQDEGANGYARGEGVVSVVMKRLSDAIADGDHIECLIRETGINQDSLSSGTTVPSIDTQEALIRQTYAEAGLDLDKPQDRPQFFEAHGAGIRADDPKEAAAISQAFMRSGESRDVPMYVGSLKTVIGHTGGAAGLASLLKCAGIIQRGTIPPNILSDELNSKIEPFREGLEVPTTLKPWPELPKGVPRRASVHSLGFGGSNAHAILEQYRPPVAAAPPRPEPLATPFTPFFFSAMTEASLVAQLESYSEYLKRNPKINAIDLAWTLRLRRSQMPIKAAFAAVSTRQLVTKIDEKLAELKARPDSNTGVRTNPNAAAPRILGVFTGQGAQWAEMGAQLIRSSEHVRKIVQNLEDSLATLPTADRPQWSLKSEMLASPELSRIQEAELSQPLCTAVQIILVDLLRLAGITFAAVVGHSSGEIGASYAAGYFSARDAIRIAYYRGYHARVPGPKRGAMLVVGTSWKDAQELVNLRAFKCRLAIAAHNSLASVTLSGDLDAVILAKKVFDEEKKFARMLKGDKAYNSHHMLPYGDPYARSLRECGVKVNKNRSTDCSWFSSVILNDKDVEPTDELRDRYWVDNMTKAVLFCDAIKNAVSKIPELSLVVEVGPHPTLKGPIAQNISEVQATPISYTGVLFRGKNDIEAFSDGLGFALTNLGSQYVNLETFDKAMTSTSSGEAPRPKLVTGLPLHQWNRGRQHSNEKFKSRKARGWKQHQVLGVQAKDFTYRDLRWSNILKPSEIPWLEGHQLQGQKVFPAAGYIAMAIEGSRILAADRPVELFEIQNLVIPRAITFDDDGNAGVKTVFTMTAIKTDTNENSSTTTADFSCYSSSSSTQDRDMELHASGSVKITFGIPNVEALFCTLPDASKMGAEIDSDKFYKSLAELGYDYEDQFRTMSRLKRRTYQSSAKVASYNYSDEESSEYLVHPTWLGVAIQTSMLAYSAPGDLRLWSIHVPTSIRTIRVNPKLCSALPSTSVDLPVCSTLAGREGISVNIDVLAEDGKHCMVQIEDLILKPVAPANEANDRHLYYYTEWDIATPDATSIVRDIRPTPAEVELAKICERISYFYLRKWKSEITNQEWANGESHYNRLHEFVNHTISAVCSGSHPTVKKEWNEDTHELIQSLVDQHTEDVDVKVILAVGEMLPAAVRGHFSNQERILPDSVLENFFEKGLGFARYNSFLASLLKQMTHRYPHAKILEIGAGISGATKKILQSIGNTMFSYAYTRPTSDTFESDTKQLEAYEDKITFRTLNIEKAPLSQGFEPNSYDIIVASNALPASSSIQKTLENARQLLKPGGYLVLMEKTSNDPIRLGTIMECLSCWWSSVNDGRKIGPTMAPEKWHTDMRKAGFAGIETLTPEIDPLTWPFSVMAAQAVDDKVEFLRQPLANASSADSIYLDSVVILGNGNLNTARIAKEIAEYLEPFSGHTTILNGLPTEEDVLHLSLMNTVVNLVDLEAPIFKGVIMTEKAESLKRTFDLAKNLLWVTMGSQTVQPYHMASVAFLRSIAQEMPLINMNQLDVDDLDGDVSRIISEHLLRQVALDEWRISRDQELLWSKEPEVCFSRGKFLLPRLVGHKSRNDRVNSLRRVINKIVPASSSKVSISLSANAPPTLVEEVLPVNRKGNQNLVKIKSSSLFALRVAANMFLYLGIGKDSTSKSRVVSLSATNASEIATIASTATGADSAAQPAERILIAVASEILATSLLQIPSSGSRLLINCSDKDRFLIAALLRLAAVQAVHITFVCDAECIEFARNPTFIKLIGRTPRHVVRTALRSANPTHFFDLTALPGAEPSELSLSIAECLPSECEQINQAELAQHQSSLPTSYSREALVGLLENAVSVTGAIATSTFQKEVYGLVTPLSEIGGSPSHVTSIVDWLSDRHIKVGVRPLDARRLFSKYRTYLLIGLVSELSFSLCEWMVKNGAGTVLLMSSDPKINQSRQGIFEENGATVKALKTDVLDKFALEKTITEIRATYPPIAGVSYGALLGRDILFKDMSAEELQDSLLPQIDGVVHLDEIFHSDPLDFFVLLSSAMAVVGNSGQSGYTAGNGFLAGMARQRRRRGVAGSTIDLGCMTGIGYDEIASEQVVYQLTKLGLMAISEVELHQVFAESIVGGWPIAGDKSSIPDAVVGTGLRKIQNDEDVLKVWFENPRLSHCTVEPSITVSSAKQSNKNTLPVGEQISKASSTEEALEVLTEYFLAKLKVLQMIDQDIDSKTPLVELGVDSMAAFAIRSWFMTELKVDIPLLKVVGGVSPDELCQLVLKKLSEEFLAGIEKQHDTQQPAAPQAGIANARPTTPKPRYVRTHSNTESRAGEDSSATSSGYNSAEESSKASTLASSALTEAVPNKSVTRQTFSVAAVEELVERE